MRLSRFEWLSRMFKPKPSAKRLRNTRAGNTLHRFDWYLGGDDKRRAPVLAFTRSDARAQIKKILGVKRSPSDLVLIDTTKARRFNDAA